MASDKFNDECGVFGVFGHPDAGALTALGLHALQHRGQAAAGIVSCDDGHFHQHRGTGEVGATFGRQEVIDQMRGDAAIGHVRYATAGGTTLQNTQPLYADYAFGGCAVAHNGNLTDAVRQRIALVNRGSIFQTTTDTEVINHLIASSKAGDVVERLCDALRRVTGAYSLVALTADKLIAVRDPAGVRPLMLGMLDGNYVVASESCALDIIDADPIRDIAPGEMVIIDRQGLRSLRPFAPKPRHFCVFEYIYFSRPDSIVDEVSVYQARKAIGAELAREGPVASADVVVPVPDSGVPAAIGYAEAAGLSFDLGIVRNHYVGRTFIEPTDRIRHLGVRLKHNANRHSVAGKSVVLVDDSIVRGTTSRKIVEMVRAAGAREVHMRISSPPTMHPCFYGINTPTSEELLANKHSIEEMSRVIGTDSLAFISIDGLYRAMHAVDGTGQGRGYCDACFTGRYPIELVDRGTDRTAENVTVLAGTK